MQESISGEGPSGRDPNPDRAMLPLEGRRLAKGVLRKWWLIANFLVIRLRNKLKVGVLKSSRGDQRPC